MKYQCILHIDDDEEDQEIFLSALNEVPGNFNCIAISDATKALKQLQEKELLPQVIFLDLNMPVMSGQQFLIELKKDSQLMNIPVIIFSTSSHAVTVNLLKELGAHDFITKPEHFDELVQILKSTLS